MAQRNLKARYQVRGPKKVTVYTNQARMVCEKGSDVPSMQTEQVGVEKEMFMVYFPQGHSIRVDKPELVRMGYHLRPRLVDMDTGEVVDAGGDPYDFMGLDPALDEPDPSVEIRLEDLDFPQEPEQAKAKAAKQG